MPWTHIEIHHHTIDSSSLCQTVSLHHHYYVPGLLCAEEHPEFLMMILYLFTVCAYLHICTCSQLCTVTYSAVSAVVSNRLQHVNITLFLFRTCCQKTSLESQYVQTSSLYNSHFLTVSTHYLLSKHPTLDTPSIQCTDMQNSINRPQCMRKTHSIHNFSVFNLDHCFDCR